MVTGYLIVVGVLILAWSQFSRTGVLRILLRTILGLLALGAAASTLLLLYVGFKNSWTSDGPAMLLVMLGILVCGGLTYFFTSLTIMSLRLAAANDGDLKPDSEFENTQDASQESALLRRALRQYPDIVFPVAIAVTTLAAIVMGLYERN